MTDTAKADWEAIGESRSVEHEKELCCEWVLKHAEPLLSALETLQSENQRLRKAVEYVKAESSAAVSSDGNEFDRYAFGRINKVARAALGAKP